MDIAIDEGQMVSLTGNMGAFHIRLKKLKPWRDAKGRIRGLPIDWKSTRALWKEYPEKRKNNEKVFYLCESTGGYLGHLLWKTVSCLNRNKHLYEFKRTREIGHRIYEAIERGVEYDYKQKFVR